jgi:hypothetical protein
MGKMRNTYKMLVGNSARKIPLGMYGHRQVDNIKKISQWGGIWRFILDLA